MSSARVVAAALVSVVLLPIAHAAPKPQTEAQDDPEVSGPLLPSSPERCTRKAEKDKKGKPAAYVRACLRLYRIPSGSEDNAARDYGVAWLQSTVNGVNGWCALVARSELIIPANVRVHARNPKPERVITERRRATQKVTTDANGHAFEGASVAQSFSIYPRKVRRVVEGRGQRVVWTGREDAKIFMATAVAYSWKTPGSADPFDSELSYRFKKLENC